MPDENLVKYIKEGLAQGRSEDVIRSLLASNSWAQKDVDDAFNFVKTGQVATSVAAMTAPTFSPSANGNGPRQAIPMGNITQTGKSERMARLKYLWWSLGVATVSIGGSYLILFLISNFFLLSGINFLLSIILFVVTIIITVRRFHDLNKSAWYLLPLILPVYNFYLLTELFLQRGTDGANRYGTDPLPPDKSNRDFANRLGSSIVFKIAVAVVLSGIALAVFVQQTVAQHRADQQVEQNMVNPLAASSTNATTSGSSKVATINQGSLTSASTYPTITGTAQGLQSVSVEISKPHEGAGGPGGPDWSDIVNVINGTWSFTPSASNQRLPYPTNQTPSTPGGLIPGSYQVLVFTPATTLLTTSTLTITTSPWQGGTDTSSWQTESIHFAQKSVCYTIKYPSTLTPFSPEFGSPGWEGFSDTSGADVINFNNDFTHSYASQTSIPGYTAKPFTTASGLNGTIMTDDGGWKIVVQAEEGGQNFLLNLNTLSLRDIPGVDIGEAMANSITLSCAIPASTQ